MDNLLVLAKILDVQVRESYYSKSNQIGVVHMKKEYKLVGKVTIPKKKRKEVKSIIQKILYLGGIREKETIEIDGRQCITAGIPKWNAREVISFNYNMFTNTSYEAGRLYLKSWIDKKSM